MTKFTVALICIALMAGFIAGYIIGKNVVDDGKPAPVNEMLVSPPPSDRPESEPTPIPTPTECNNRKLGPPPPLELPEIEQTTKNVDQGSNLISEPTPTPTPTMVYCNDNGKYYHLKGCRYVNEKTPRVTLSRAKNAGKMACPTCNPPGEEPVPDE